MACCTMAWPWLRQRLLLCHQVQWTTFSPPDALGTMTMSSVSVHYFNFSFLDSLAGLTLTILQMLVFSKVPLFFSSLYSTRFVSPIPKSISTAFDLSTLFPARYLFQAPDLDIYLLARYFQSITVLKLASSLSYLRFLCS